ncbi:DNA polymerase III subunit delta [Sediminibacillus albus]|uniref:DNA polymerase III subunit delta n=1 Tax=Sediminibacillus albus TaxID=407036 RepID=A0A1G9CMZ3_9BACI|nr:DNA polymerase III subunit delta [Sediminibacillus albus]SDK53073.1 DNA polymerase III, delta subunit [Sediminibacillus albus]
MSYLDTIKNIKKKNFSPVYLVYGTESYLIQDIRQQIIRYALEVADRDTSISTYDLEETSIQEVIEDAETYPFLSDRKVIFANNPVFLKAKPDKITAEHNIEVLQNYLLQPAESTILVFIAPYEKIDERKKITKTLKKGSEYVECQPVKEWDLPKWIQSLAKEAGVVVEEEAYDLIGQEVGTNLLMLKQEIDKMALYAGENETISKNVAEQLISHNTNTSGLKLVDAVIEKNLSKAIHIFKDLEKTNEDAIGLISLLASQFRTIMHVKILQKKGYSQKQMAQQLKVHPYVVKMSQKRERNFSLEELQGFIHIFTETDAQIKQGKMDKTLAFELLLYQLIHHREAGQLMN